jgi:hypothetical protein
MTKNSAFRKSLLLILLTTTTIGCNLTSSQRNISGERFAETPKIDLKPNIKSKKISKPPWSDVSQYDEFVRSTVDNYFASDMKEIYKFYNIKKDLPKYGFKQNSRQFVCFDCEGAVFKEREDSIYFYSTCLEELFVNFMNHFKNNKEDPREELTKRIHHYIKHEGAHDIYSKFGKEIGEKNLFKRITDNTPPLEVIQYTMVQEGVADYISYKGQLTESAKRFTDEDFKKMIEEKDDSQVYDFGALLVKGILDIDLEKGIKELIKNPLTKDDLNDLPAYRERIIANVLEEVEKE